MADHIDSRSLYHSMSLLTVWCQKKIRLVKLCLPNGHAHCISFPSNNGSSGFSFTYRKVSLFVWAKNTTYIFYLIKVKFLFVLHKLHSIVNDQKMFTCVYACQAKNGTSVSLAKLKITAVTRYGTKSCICCCLFKIWCYT